MNVLFVHEKFGAFAGAESNVLATANGLKERGHEVGILHGVSTGKSTTAWERVFEFRLPLGNEDGVAAALESFRPDVIYVHKLSDLEDLTKLWRSGHPLARMVHDHDLCCMRSYKYNYFTRQICERAASPFCVLPCGAFLARDASRSFPVKWVSYSDKRREIELNKKFDRLVVASQFMQEELVVNGFDPGKIEIHPPVPAAFGVMEPSNFSDRNLIIYAGQIVRGKGVDVLLESLALINAPFECFIFGDGGHRAHCEKLSRRLGLSSRVHFKGYVPPEELNCYYGEASVAVVSSVWPEPFGATGLEAMRRGVPVVAFDVGGIREWLLDGFNGFLAPQMDCAAFAARVKHLLRDKLQARTFGRRGQAMVAEHFGFPKYLDGLEQMFARLAEPALPARVSQV